MKNMLMPAWLPLLAGLAFAGPAESGKAVFDKSCKGCHGATGQGNPGIAKAMKVELRHLGSKEVQAKSDGDLKSVITAGVGKMKPVAAVKGQAADDVVAFLRTLKQ